MIKWINIPDASSNDYFIEIKPLSVEEAKFREALRDTIKEYDDVLRKLCDCCNTRFQRWWRHFFD